MSKKVYHLTIVYDKKTDEIEYIQEEVKSDELIYFMDGIDINDYFSQDDLDLLSESYIVGES
jgi:hypothetical protein